MTLPDLDYVGAHAVNPGRLIWVPSIFQKVHNPQKFWEACLKHCEGSYRRWVYNTEAQRVGVDSEYGWWKRGFIPKCKVATQYLDYVEFAGVVANGRVFRGNNGKYIPFVTLGIGPAGEYIDIQLSIAQSCHRDGGYNTPGQRQSKTSNNS